MIPIINKTKNILNPYNEVRTDYGKMIDSIFLPSIGDKKAPQVGIVQEYKKCTEK